MAKENNSIMTHPLMYIFMGMLIMLLLIASGYGIYRLLTLATNVNTTNNTPAISTTGTGTTDTGSTGTDTSGSGTGTTTPTTTTTKVYFYKTPLDYYRTIDDIMSFTRQTTDANVNLITYSMDQLLTGPNASEKANGYVLPFTLSGTSTCAGGSYKYTVSGGTTLNLTICKDINPRSDGSGYAGSGLTAEARVLKAIMSTMTVGAITKVQVYDKNGACYAPDSGQNNCI